MRDTCILIADDDREIVHLLQGYLKQAGYQTLAAHNGETALHLLRAAKPDLLLLDLMLPDRDGWEITRIIRSDPALADIPLIMLTARIEDVDKIVGLELGADDYVTKPFNPREVMARVQALLRRTKPGGLATPSIVCVGELRLDTRQREVHKGESLIELTPTEFNLLKTLMENPGYAFTRSELIHKALGYEYEGIDRTLDSHIKNLRQKLGDDSKNPHYIQTIYGVGYRMSGTA